MSPISFPLFEKKQRRSGADNDARLAVDRENVLYDGHGRPVLDKDGHPVYVDRELGQRPLLNTGDGDSLGALPPEEKTAEAEEGFGTLPSEEKTADAEEGFGTLPPEKSSSDETRTDPLSRLLETADPD